MSNLFDNLEDKPVVEPSPFEALFDIEPGSTETNPMVPIDAFGKVGGSLVDPTTGEVVEQTVDASEAELDREERLEDLKLQGQLGTIHDAAMGAFHQQQTLAQEVDPKFSARNSEVAAQFLNIALTAVANRATVKNNRQKLRISKQTAGSPNTVNNNVIVANRNDVLRSLFRGEGAPVAPLAETAE